MKRLLLMVTALSCFNVLVNSQLLTWTPAFPKDNSNITITVDATKGNQGLMGFSGNVYVHIGLITSASTAPNDWKYAPFTWGTTPANGQAVSAGTNKWSYTINNIRSFFNVPAAETIKRIAILFRDGAGNLVQRNSDGSDMYVPVYDNNLAVRFTDPPLQPFYNPIPEPINKQAGDNISVTAIASESSTMKLYLNGTEIQSASSVTTISANPTLTTSGNTEIVVEANNGTATKKDTLRFFVSPGVVIAPLPAGTRTGINYAANNTEVTLVLNAPNKSRVSVIGEFPGSNWAEQSQYQMKKTPDGNYWWVTITGLTPGTEYAYQYLVNGTLKIADPYAEKILDPYNNNDQNIPAATYPNLKAYPTGSTTGIVSILQTNAPGYTWVNNSFARPDKRNLFVYEMLVRDFVAAHDWKTLRDTISYFKRLGINAIEIMPFNEFEGNESWGYNPDFYFAPDKYYGPKNTLKEFIDVCHSNGIAVIMDIALNHSFGLSPMVQLYWDATNNRPAADNPWFNPVAKHPFNVGYDMNHESLDTRYYFSRIVEHWLTEYKIDGFRFDLSKGFTQVNSGSDVNAWSQYDASRIAIWKRYYDTLQLKSPGSYAILEHFAANNEEIELSNYGMMFWGNMNYNFSEASMGWIGNSNFDQGLYSSRGWTNPHLVTYMESHDEERMMYKNVVFGNTSANQNTRDTAVALKRVEMCAAFLMGMPGPKMIWQFGELGYDYSINYCQSGGINPDCRLDKKPIRWDYKQNERRRRLYDIFSSLAKLKFHTQYKDVFAANNVTIERNLGAAFKWMKIRSALDSSQLVVIGNFDVNAQTGSVTFNTAGTWYDYLTGSTITATGAVQNITLQPGEYHVYLNRNITNVVTTPVFDVSIISDKLLASVYPNPAKDNTLLELSNPENGKVQISVFNISGQKVNTVFSGNLAKGIHYISLSGKINSLVAGVYMINVQTNKQTNTLKLIVQ